MQPINRLFCNMKVAGSNETFEPAGAMPTDTAVLLNVRDYDLPQADWSLPKRRDTLDDRFDDFGHTRAIDAVYRTASRELCDMLRHV